MLKFEAQLWVWAIEKGAWYFVSLPRDLSEDLKMLAQPGPGFGSIKVEVNLGESTWRTSIFPDKTRGFLLPIKKTIRDQNHLTEGSTATISLRPLI